jgi:hypothetical protein
VEISDTPDQLLKGLTERIFKQLIRQGDAKRFIIHLFRMKYDRIDFNYLDNKNIYKLFE